MNDTNDTDFKKEPVLGYNETVMSDETENEKSRSVSIALGNKIKSMLQNKMNIARLDIIR